MKKQKLFAILTLVVLHDDINAGVMLSLQHLILVLTIRTAKFSLMMKNASVKVDKNCDH